MTEITVTQRPLLETSIEEDLIPDSEKVISWLEEHATAPHKNEAEYFMWVPPSQEFIKAEYGDNIPEIILDILTTALTATQNSPDQGYLLIVIS